MLSYLLEFLETDLKFTDSKCSINISWVLCDIFLDTLVEPLNPHNNELLLYIKCFPVCINWITCYKVDILCSALLGFSIKQVNVLPCSFKWTWDCVFVCSGCYKQKNATDWASHKQLSKPGDWGPRSTYHRDGVLVKDTNLIHKASVLWPKHLPKSPAFYWPYFQGLGFQHVNFEGPQHSYPSRQGWSLSWEESEKTRELCLLFRNPVRGGWEWRSHVDPIWDTEVRSRSNSCFPSTPRSSVLVFWVFVIHIFLLHLKCDPFCPICTKQLPLYKPCKTSRYFNMFMGKKLCEWPFQHLKYRNDVEQFL